MTSPELLAEERLWIRDALKIAMPGGFVPSPNTINRWTTAGVVTSGVKRVVLETVRIGGRLASSEAAVRRFIAAQQTTFVVQFFDATGETAVPIRTPAGRNKAADAAGEQLRLMGC